VRERSSAKVYLPSGKVAARYTRSGRTIDRWTRDPKLGFPKPIVIRGKRFWDEASLEQFERNCACAKVGVSEELSQPKTLGRFRSGNAQRAATCSSIQAAGRGPRAYRSGDDDA